MKQLGDINTREDAEILRARLVQLATGTIERGVLQEPRGYFDLIAVNNDPNILAQSEDGVFLNGENMPVRITHMTATLGYLDTDQGAVVDERLLQRVGMRMIWHNSNYMNPEFLPLPLWGNICTGTSPAIWESTCSWMFPVPFILSARDTMVVTVSIAQQPVAPATQTAYATLDGIGMLSGRPYLLSGRRELATTNEGSMNTGFFQNDGGEPIIVRGGTVHLGAATDQVDPTGDIRNLSIQVQQAGNGTSAQWFKGPVDPTPVLMPAPLFGVTTGRAVVHRFPGDGMIWEPGESLNVQVQGLTANSPQDVVAAIGLFGYIVII